MLRGTKGPKARRQTALFQEGFQLKKDALSIYDPFTGEQSVVSLDCWESQLGELVRGHGEEGEKGEGEEGEQTPESCGRRVRPTFTVFD